MIELIDKEYQKGRSTLYTDQELLNYLRQFYEENRRVPEQLDFSNNHKYPSFGQYRKRFGSWNNALKLVGLDVYRFTKTTDGELLEYLKQFYEENGRVPVENDFTNNRKYPGNKIFYKRFGSWLKALELVGLDKYRNQYQYTDEELLNYLRQFYEENGRTPTIEDFTNNSKYPGFATITNRFGSWEKAKKLVGLDIESMVKRGIIDTNDQKSRFAEIIVRNHFKKYPIDLAGENRNSPCDGICPNDMTYDVKGSKLHTQGKRRYYYFGIYNKYKEEIEIFYLLAFSEDWTKLDYGLRIPGEMIERNTFYLPISKAEKMKEYHITDKLREVLRKHGFFDQIEK